MFSVIFIHAKVMKRLTVLLSAEPQTEVRTLCHTISLAAPGRNKLIHLYERAQPLKKINMSAKHLN